MTDDLLQSGPLPQTAMEQAIAALKAGGAHVPGYDNLALLLGRAAERGEVDYDYARDLLADYDTVSGADAPGDDRRDRMLVDRYGRIEGLRALDALAVDAQQGNPGASARGADVRTVNPDGNPRPPAEIEAAGGEVPTAPPDKPAKPAAPAAVTDYQSSQPATGKDMPAVADKYGVQAPAAPGPVTLGAHIGDAWRQLSGMAWGFAQYRMSDPLGTQAAAAVVKDVAGGVVEAPLQAVQGARDAGQAWLDFAEWAGDNVENLVPLSGVDTADRQLPVLPGVTHDARTVTGGLVHGAAQWLASFAGVAKLVPVLVEAKAAGGAAQVTASVAQAGLAGFLGFSPEQGRLSDLFVKQFPQAQNAVTDWLKTDPGDNEGLARFKTALETMGFGVATDGLVALLRAGRAAEGTKPPPAATGSGRDVVNVASPEPAPVIVSGEDAAARKLAKAGDELAADGKGADATARASDRAYAATPLDAQGSVYANWDALLARISAGTASPKEIEGLINDVAVTMKPETDAARRGVQTHADTLAKSGDVDAFAVLMARRAGQPLSAEQTVAAGALWKGAAQKLQELARAAAADPSAENLFAARQMMVAFYAIQKEVLGARAEIGRALDAWKLVGKGDAQGQMMQILNAEGGLDTNLALMQKLAGINDLTVLSDLVDKSLYAKTRDSVQEYFFGSILSGPKTHLVNVISNTTIAVLHLAETAVASRMGALLGGDAGAVGEAMANVQGMLAGTKDAFRAAARAFVTGESDFGGIAKYAKDRGDVPAISSTAWNLASDSWAGMTVDALGAVVRTPGRMLMSEDEWFKTVVERGSLYQQAFRQARQEIAEGTLKEVDAKARIAALVENPPPAFRDAAVTQAHYQTLTTPPGDLTAKINSIRAQYPVTRFILPFLQVPANAFKMVGEHSPAAPLMAKYKAAIDKGGQDAYLARTKMAVGTTTLLTGLDFTLDGRMTGSGPPPGSERDEWLRAGNQPYSVKLGDRWYAYNRVEPVGSILSYAADLGEWLVNHPDASDEDASFFSSGLGAVVFAAAENATSKSYLRGFSDLIEAMGQPDRFAQSYVENFLGGLLIPRAVTEGAMAIDPTMRATDGIMDELKSRSPWASAELAPVRDLWGRPVDYRSGIGIAFDAISPVYSSKYAPEPVDRAMEELGVFIGMPAKNFTLGGGNVRLSNAQYSEYLGLRGQTKAGDLPGNVGTKAHPVTLIQKYGNLTLLEAENALVQTEAFKALIPERREASIRAIADDYRAAAKAVMLQLHPEIGERADRDVANRYRLQPLPPQ